MYAISIIYWFKIELNGFLYRLNNISIKRIKYEYMDNVDQLMSIFRNGLLCLYVEDGKCKIKAPDGGETLTHYTFITNSLLRLGKPYVSFWLETTTFCWKGRWHGSGSESLNMGVSIILVCWKKIIQYGRKSLLLQGSLE